ncbi:MAG TPA: 16S rRNA (uracil(1498)-N(3))-methyltransferase [Caldilineaceae bacterium]|nr:16S rRNA (uracil(1498)-N(3))-methyltransferase [Caldilineaceae bacterium]
MHRFFLTESPLRVNQSVDLAPLAHQLRKVLRLAPGALITLLDNQGNEFDVRLVDLHAKGARGEVLTTRVNRAEPEVCVTLYQCSLKADKFEWVLQKGTELGVRCFVPVISERSVVRPAAALLKKYDRWRAIMREAAEQCGRGRLPDLLDPMDWSIALHHAEGLRLFPWESRAESAPALHTLATQLLSSPGQAALLIGPEGGISTGEADQAHASGWQSVSLGPRILRAETAALAAVTLLMAANEPR